MNGNVIWQVLGWVALGLNVWGNLMLTSKGVSGWIIRLACNVCWIPYSINTGAWALLANHVLFAGINIYGWHKWKAKDKISLTLSSFPQAEAKHNVIPTQNIRTEL